MSKGEIISAVGGCLLIFAAGCNIKAPRPRMGTLPTPPPGPRYVDPDNIGKHSYHFDLFEKNAQVYTCKGGHIDLTHVRWNADYTRYFIERICETLLENEQGFHYNLTWEPSTHYISFDYPANWKQMGKQQREKIADEIAFEAAPYIAFNSTLWHEIITWFGTKFAAFEPEFNSAFSWEDNFSNLVGVRLGLKAMRSGEDYDQAMTEAIDKELEKLGGVSKKTAIQATEKMRGKWYSGLLHVDTKKRNMDIGLDDGYITATLMPNVEGCGNPEPISYPVPVLTALDKYGFEMTHEVSPNVWETGKITDAIRKQTGTDQEIEMINIEKHYPVLMEFIKKQAVEKYGYDIDT